MTFRDIVLANGGQPEIWFEFENTLAGSGYGERGTEPLYVVSGSALTGYGEPVGEGLPSGSNAMWFNNTTRARSGGSGAWSFAMFDGSAFGVWVKPATPTKTVSTVWNFNTSGGTTGTGWIRLDIINGIPQIRGGSATVIANANVNIMDDQWHHIVWKRTGGTTGDLWVDGVLRASANTSALTESISGFMWIGDNGYAPYGDFYAGYLTHPWHYPGGITDQNIINQYQLGISPPPKPVVFRGWGLSAK